MTYRSKRSTVLLTMVIMFIVQLDVALSAVGSDQSSNKKFTAIGHYTGPGGCHPVQVTAASVGSRPPEVLTGQVTITSFSDKPVAAIKLTWEVYRWDVAMKKRRSNCDVGSEGVETVLSGSTDIIQLGQFARNETCNISTYPLLIDNPATKTVFIDQPIIAWDQVKPLTLDGTRRTFKEDFAAVIYVSEIQFADGSRWTGTLK